jgi:hypothetical protein
MANHNRAKNTGESGGIYRPKPALEVKAVLDLRRFVPKPTVKRRRKLKQPTPLGRALKHYAMLYHTDWRAIAQLLAKIDAEYCANVTAETVEGWAEYGEMPDAFQMQTVCYIMGIKNPWTIRPKASAKKRAVCLTADVKDWQYLDVAGDTPDTQTLEVEAEPCRTTNTVGE